MHRFAVRGVLVAAVMAPLIAFSRGRTTAEAVTIPAPPDVGLAPPGSALETVVLAGGCFWGIEAVYEHAIGPHPLANDWLHDTLIFGSAAMCAVGAGRHANGRRAWQASCSSSAAA